MQGSVQEANAQRDRATINRLLAEAEVAESLSNTQERHGNLEASKLSHTNAKGLRAKARAVAEASGQLLHRFLDAPDYDTPTAE